MNTLGLTTRYYASVNAAGQLEIAGSSYAYAIGNRTHPVQHFFEHLNKRFDCQELEEWLRVAMSDAEATTMSTIAFATTDKGWYHFVGCAGDGVLYAISADLSTTRQVVALPEVSKLLVAASLVNIAGFIQLPVFNTETHAESIIKLPVTEINDKLSYVDGLLLCPHITETDKGGLSGRYHVYRKIEENDTDSTICVNGNLTMMIPNQDCHFDFV